MGLASPSQAQKSKMATLTFVRTAISTENRKIDAAN
jgi:hypothetical protein